MRSGSVPPMYASLAGENGYRERGSALAALAANGKRWMDLRATLKPFSVDVVLFTIHPIHVVGVPTARATVLMNSITRAFAFVPLFRACPHYQWSLHNQFRAYATATVRPPDIYDVVCVGGGPAGLTLLTALRTGYFSSFHVG